MKREEAITIIKELLDACSGLDGHPVELAPPTTPLASGEGYQIIIRGILDAATRNGVEATAAQHQLALQVGSMWKTKRTLSQEPDTLILYRRP